MQTKHYIVRNIEDYSNNRDAVKELKEYLGCVDDTAFPVIEEVFGQVWNDEKIGIVLDSSEGKARYRPCDGFHRISMGIYNKNIRKKYPENLWGCLFHETHHAFLGRINHNKRDGKILNGNRKTEIFNNVSMAMTYLRLKETNKIGEKLYNGFLGRLENKFNNDEKKLFREYLEIFQMRRGNFAKFINCLESDNSLFRNSNDFEQDLKKMRDLLIV